VLVRSVPLEGGACDEVDTGALGTLLTLLDEPGAPRAELELPCRSGDADLWFAESPAELERAKALCGGCPVRVACLAGALQREEPWGVWGGEIFERGLVVPRKRPRGRPSKADLARDAAYAAARAAVSA
jgi:WhiB family transcriptional regulator, redox-sensing transcriptional regulator